MMPSNVQMARMLGWTSIGLGVTELAATKWVEEQIGVDDHEMLIRCFGAREIASGITILNNVGLTKTMTAGLWSRVFGDLLDLAALGVASATTRNRKGWLAVTGFVVGALGLDALVASRACAELARANKVAEEARNRVQRRPAIPNGNPQQAGDGRQMESLAAQI